MMLIYHKLFVGLTAIILLGFEPTLMAEQKPAVEQKSVVNKQKSSVANKQKPVVDKQKSTQNQQDNQSKNHSKSKKGQNLNNIIKKIQKLVSKR